MKLPIVPSLGIQLVKSKYQTPENFKFMVSSFGSLAQWKPHDLHMVDDDVGRSACMMFGLIIISVFMGCACAIASGALAMADAT